MSQGGIALGFVRVCLLAPTLLAPCFISSWAARNSGFLSHFQMFYCEILTITEKADVIFTFSYFLLNMSQYADHSMLYIQEHTKRFYKQQNRIWSRLLFF